MIFPTPDGPLQITERQAVYLKSMEGQEALRHALLRERGQIVRKDRNAPPVDGEQITDGTDR